MPEGWQFQSDRNGARMRHASSRQLYRYWDRLRGPRPAPDRAEVEPADIGRILSDTFILEVVDERSYDFRLAGSRICSAFGRERKGENWLDGWSPRDREALATLMRSIVSDAAGAVIAFEGRNPRSQPVGFEALLLPLINRGPRYDRILGSLVPLDTPYWLGALPIIAQSIVDLSLIWPDSAPVHGYPSTEEHSAFAMAAPLRRHRHLALYDGGQPD